MGLYDACQTSVELETQGQIFEYPDIGVRVACKRAGGHNKGYNKALARRSKDVQRAIDIGAVDLETMDAILLEVFVDEVIIAWATMRDGEWVNGIESRDGTILPFNRDNVIATLKALPVVFERIKEDAQRHANYLASLRQEQAKN